MGQESGSAQTRSPTPKIENVIEATDEICTFNLLTLIGYRIRRAANELCEKARDKNKNGQKEGNIDGKGSFG